MVRNAPIEVALGSREIQQKFEQLFGRVKMLVRGLCPVMGEGDESFGVGIVLARDEVRGAHRFVI